MKVLRLDKDKERLGLCNNCHNRAQLEIQFGSKGPRLRLCVRDAQHLLAKLTEELGPRDDARGNR